jgi:hypothetical protein
LIGHAEAAVVSAIAGRSQHITMRAMNHVAVLAEQVQDRVNREVIFCAASLLSAIPLTYFMRMLL